MASAQQLTDAEYERILLDDELYFECCLQIRTKDEGIQPLLLNSSQRYAHEQIEKQRAETGRVRVLILKGRQQGISTYIGGRFYKKVSTSYGVLAFIVTHEDAATQNLFGMTKRYHDNNLPDFKPETGVANANELKFSRLDSGYKIATAGARTAGRSNTIQYLHASEFDFWPEASADEVWRGLYEAVPDADGTEVVIESTADKPGGRFHRSWQAAKRGDSPFMALFIPWFVHDEYRKTPPPGWQPPAAFEEYMVLYGLDIEQVYWAWNKNRSLAMTFGSDPDQFCLSFKREYPATDDEAFEQASDDLERVFPLPWIRAAQARWRENKNRPKHPMTGLGVDVAQGGPDRTMLAPLHKVRYEEFIGIPGVITTDGPAVAGAVVTHVRDGAVIAVDVTGGWGGSALTHLKDHLNMPAVGVNSSEKSHRRSRDSKLGFKNTRADMHWDFREALNPVTGDDVEIPPDEELVEEMLAATFTVTPQGILILDKDEMKKVLRRSPDKLDALLLAWRAGGMDAAALVSATVAGRPPQIIQHRSKVIGRR